MTTSLTTGSVKSTLCKLAFPLFLSHLFHQLYSITDALILGRFVGDNALAAVCATGCLISLLIGFFQGIALGAERIITRGFRAHDTTQVHRAVRTGLLASTFAGVCITVVGLLLTPLLLRAIRIPAILLPEATQYLRLCLCGSLGTVLYSACQGVFAATGDVHRPLFYLAASSLLNIVLDVLFVCVWDWGVTGAAVATVITQVLSAVLCLIRLFYIKNDGYPTEHSLCIDRTLLRDMAQHSLPVGLQNTALALSHTYIQYHINPFGVAGIVGFGVYFKVELLLLLPITGVSAAVAAFIAENQKAGNRDRAQHSTRFGVTCSLVLALAAGVLLYAIAPAVIGLFTHNHEAIHHGVNKAHICAPFFVMWALSQSLNASLSSSGHTVLCKTTKLVYQCGVRILFLAILFTITQSPLVIDWVYPLSWTLSALTLLIGYVILDHK